MTANRVRRAKPKVMVVDDDALIRRPLEFILRQEGFRPLTAVDGNDCLQQLRNERPDLILLDVMLPGRDGLDVCAELKKNRQWASIPVVLLSAIGREQERQAALALGADGFVSKPYAPAELIRLVRRLLSNN